MKIAVKASENPILDVPTPSLAEIAKKHGVKLEWLQKQLQAGIKIEREHTTDDAAAAEIARDHLNERPDYYMKLKQVEGKKAMAVVIPPRTRPSNRRPKIGTQVAPPVPAMSPYIRVFGAADPLASFKDRQIKEVVQHLRRKSLDELLDILHKRLRLTDKNSALAGLWDQLVMVIPQDEELAAKARAEMQKVLVYEAIAAGVVNGSKKKVKAVIDRLIAKFKTALKHGARN